MAKKKAKEGEEKGGGNNKMMYILVAVVALLAYKMFMGGAKPTAGATGADGATPTSVTTAPGPIVTLAPITINISGGRFLKVGLGLQLAGDHKTSGHGADSDDPTKGYARALDLAIEVFGGKAYDALVTPEGRREAKEELTHRLEEAYHDEIEGVYFTDFVMQ
jgi:flagellar FliL protein